MIWLGLLAILVAVVAVFMGIDWLQRAEDEWLDREFSEFNRKDEA